MYLPISLPGVAETSLYYAFRNSDVLGKAIVVGLFLFSMITWIVMIEKGFGLKSALRDSAAFLSKFRAKRNPFSFADRIEEDPSPAARVCEAGYLRISEMNVVQSNGTRRALTFSEVDIVRATLEQAVADQIIVLEGKMIFLATAVSISPFLGLFGTVWGIMLAFTELAIAGKADIQTLAPGVSGALLTTVLGLVVAIPSVVGYNIITSQIKSTIVHLDNFVEEFIVKLKIENLVQEEQLTQEKQEQERKNQLEQALREQERLRQQEQMRQEIQQTRQEQERLKQLEQTRQEQERLERERRQFEQERQEQERLKQLEKTRQEQERLERERRQFEQERQEQERLKQLEQSRLEQERQEREQQEQSRPEQNMQEQPSLLQPDPEPNETREY